MKEIILIIIFFLSLFFKSYSQNPLSVNGIISNSSCDVNGLWSINLTVNGGTIPYTYNWSNGMISEDIDSLVIGTYIITITDNIGNNIIDTFNINQPSTLIVNLTQQDETCYGYCNGLIVASPQGGQPPYSYLWSNFETQSLIDSLCPGTYSLTVSDFNGCSVITNSVVVGHNILELLLVYTDTATNGQANGSAAVTAIGGSWMYSYEWIPNVSNSSIATGLFPGLYTVIVIDANNCTDTIEFTILNDTITSIDINNNSTNKISISPNPFTNETNIQFLISETSNITIELFDNSGELIYLENLGMMHKGQFTYALMKKNVNMKSGLYFLKVRVNNIVYIKKILKY